MGKFEITNRSNGEFQFNLKAGKGEIILTSEGYTTKSSCQNGVESVRSNSQDDSKFDSKTSSNDKFYFNLKATNGQIIGTSQMYEGSSGSKNGMESVKTNAKNDQIDDQTN